MHYRFVVEGISCCVEQGSCLIRMEGFAPVAIGLTLTLIHLISIPVTNTSVNPARSTAPAIFVGGWAVAQLWLFSVAPIIGGALGGGIYHAPFAEGPQQTVRDAERAR